MKILEKTVKFETKWLSFINVKYLNKEGKEMFWDFVSRKGNTKVVTLICHSKQTNKILLISQPRVPINKIVIEFPAGLIDEGESIEKAGLRELKEETGFDAEITRVTPFVVKSAGLSDETTAFVEGIVDEKAVGKSEMEPTEDIQSFWITPDEFFQLISNLDHDKYIVDTQVYCYFMSQGMSKKKIPKKK